MLKHHEFWHPKVFETPVYFYLAWLCLRYRLSPSQLAKANSALDHGEIGIGSKFHTQQQFCQDYFLPTELLDFGAAATNNATLQQNNVAAAERFAQQHGWPLIFKPDIGMVGKGILKVDSLDFLEQRIDDLSGKYLMQKFTPAPMEFGVFYMRYKGKSRITGINRKHFPTVTGNGIDTIKTLAQSHERYSAHWDTFLQYIDQSVVLEKGQQKRLSFIGSHTMGCKFTDDSHLITAELEQVIFALLDEQADFNYGRLDVKTQDEVSLGRGDLVVIEVNGISSLPTHMFDPSYGLVKCYKIFFNHVRQLVKIAKENRHKSMHLLPFPQILKRVKMNQSALDTLHETLKS